MFEGDSWIAFGSALFIVFYFFFAGFVCAFLSFPLNIYYLYTQIPFNQFNKILQYFHNYLTIYIIVFFFLHSTPVLFVLFLSFLLNIYVCIYSYTHNTFLQYFHNH